MGARVIAGGTYLRCFFAGVNMAAVPALPLYFLFFLKNSALIEVIEKSQETFFMFLFYCGH